jgi:hypothetical protein
MEQIPREVRIAWIDTTLKSIQSQQLTTTELDAIIVMLNKHIENAIVSSIRPLQDNTICLEVLFSTRYEWMIHKTLRQLANADFPLLDAPNTRQILLLSAGDLVVHPFVEYGTKYTLLFNNKNIVWLVTLPVLYSLNEYLAADTARIILVEQQDNALAIELMVVRNNESILGSVRAHILKLLDNLAIVNTK